MIQYAIYDTASKLYYRNTTGYGGHWHEAPKLFMRKSDAKMAMAGRKDRPNTPWVTAIIIPMKVEPL